MNIRRKNARNKQNFEIIKNIKKKKKNYFFVKTFNSYSIYSKVFNLLKILIIIIIIILNIIYKRKKLKIAICTMGKHENKYVKEFIEYYEKLGIDNIYIYDDNDINGERIKDVVPLTKKIKVKVFDNIKDRIKKQADAYTECYNNNKNIFDWFLMIDLDEYLFIRNTTIRNYLNSPYLKKCDIVKIHWLIPTDNNLVYYDNRTLLERFPGPFIPSNHIKSLVRGNIDGLKYWIHSPMESPYRNVTCDNAGVVQNYTNLNFQSIFRFTTEKAYFIHFQFKSTEEYINKMKRGYSNWDWVRSKPRDYIFNYFKNNNIKLSKIEFFEREFNLSLDDYRKKINNKK